MTFETQTILLTEDNEDDIFIFERAFRKSGATNRLEVVRDGQEAHDYLAGAGKFADRKQFPLPALMLLDLKLPLRNGLELLEWLRSQPKLKNLPVVVLTSSAEHRDLDAARELGARYYLVKPPTPKTIAEIIALFRAEWEGRVATQEIKPEGDWFNRSENAQR